MVNYTIFLIFKKVASSIIMRLYDIQLNKRAIKSLFYKVNI